MENIISDVRKQEICDCFASVRAKMAEAGAGDSVCLLAATKHVPANEINYAIHELGLTCIGENRVQELLEKYDDIDHDAVQVHFIGGLQTNKVKYIVGKVDLIHSLDSLSLAKEIERQAAKRGLVQDVLVEINVCEEESKGGILLAELPVFLEEISAFSHIRIRGLMTMGQRGMDREDYRAHFLRVRDAWAQLRERGWQMDVLSMGMSDSYEIAIECGSNTVRVGTALFGARAVTQ